MDASSTAVTHMVQILEETQVLSLIFGVECKYRISQEKLVILPAQSKQHYVLMMDSCFVKSILSKQRAETQLIYLAILPILKQFPAVKTSMQLTRLLSLVSHMIKSMMT